MGDTIWSLDNIGKPPPTEFPKWGCLLHKNGSVNILNLNTSQLGCPSITKIPKIGTQQMRQVQSLQSLQYLTILQNFYFCMWQMWWLISTLARYNLTQLQCQYFLALSCSAGRVSLESTLRHVQKCFENIDIFIMLSIFLSLRISQVKGEQTRSRKQFSFSSKPK